MISTPAASPCNWASNRPLSHMEFSQAAIKNVASSRDRRQLHYPRCRANSTLGAAANAGFAVLTAQAGVALVNNGGDIGKTLAQLGSEQSIKNMLTAMATAGAIQALNPGVNPVATGQSGPAAQATSTTQAVNDFVGNLQRNVSNNLAGTVIASAINGKPLTAEALQSALSSALITSGMASGANAIGDAKDTGSLNNYTQALAHPVLGCAAGAASTAGGCAPGALGGVVGELTAKYADEAGISKDNALALAKTVSAAAGLLAGGSGSNVAAVNIASQTGGNAAQYNRQLHPEETRLARQLAARAQQGGLRKADGSAYTAQDMENALRNSGNTQLGETVATGMVVNTADKAGVYDRSAVFNAGEPGTNTIVQQLPNGARVDAQLAAFIQSSTGGASSPYSWNDVQLGKAAPAPVDPNAGLNRVMPAANGCVTAECAANVRPVTKPNDAAAAVGVGVAITGAGAVTGNAGLIGAGVNLVGQGIKASVDPKTKVSLTEAVISGATGGAGAAAAEAQVIKSVIQQGGAAAAATSATIGATSNVASDVATKAVKGEEITVKGTLGSAVTGAAGANVLPKNPVIPAAATEVLNAVKDQITQGERK